jgi:hypothetical protein
MPKSLTAVFISFFSLLMSDPAAAAEKNLREEWMVWTGKDYHLMDSTSYSGLSTIYVKLDAGKHRGGMLKISSAEKYFLFINGKLIAEHSGRLLLSVDSLADAHYSSALLIAVHQEKINERDLQLSVLDRAQEQARVIIEKPDTWFRDFVIAAGLLIIILFVVISQVNPKLASDYFSVLKIFSLREADDIQAAARLTSSTNVQFYISCSLLLGYYLLILFQHLPGTYAIPIQFQSHSFGSAIWQWIKLSTIILGFFFLKITIIFSLTRLFGMRGMARLHFFNWVRLMLIVFGICSIVVFLYFINHGQRPEFFATFLSVIGAALIGWVLLAFLKLNGKSEHSLFHLFSYICATEIIPLLITVKVLYQ